MSIQTLLIANRGEIALRVMRTAARLGIRTIAIHTDLDDDAPHVRAADDAVHVDSYLDIEAVVAAAVESGAEAVHPGYGFLSERAAFARALEAAGITLVGPSAAVIEQMGRKDAARELAVAAGVPVVPTGDDAAYPVLVKAAAGGGGKGMRIVRLAEEMAEARAAAAREALHAFGDDTLLVEKYVERGRHIEVQVIGDAHGTVLHLFERDCSTQRRHQKVLEEAPAPTITAEQRERVTSAAVALARHVGYVNAGTVEFLLDDDTGEVYFLEMNTRLQVEHPVTEAITGVDLVELQLRVADGEPLGLAQDDVRVRGHAIEARVYAEDSFAGFLPQAGTAGHVHWPSGDGVRVDAALESGQEVSTAYDPMLGKVIAWDEDREQARERLVAALDDTAILGLTTNAGFLRVLVASEEFRDATIDTAWLDRNDVSPPEDVVPRAMAGLLLASKLAQAPASPWQPDRFRLGGDAAGLVEDGQAFDLRPVGGWYAVHSGRHGHPAEIDTAAGRALGERTRTHTEVVFQGQRFVFERFDPARDTVVHAGDGTLVAPMPGTVLEVRVADGDVVEEGQVLGVMEAMKMELSLKAPFAGTVQVSATAGTQVPLGAALFVVTPA